MTKDALRTRATPDRPTERLNPAQVFCVVVGASLVAGGVLGFFYNADFSTGAATTDPANRDAVLGLLDVNGWHNVVHLLTGAAALALAPSASAARGYAIFFGAAYALVATLGFAYGDGDSIFKLIPVNTEDNVLHVLFAVSGIASGVASRTVPQPSAA